MDFSPPSKSSHATDDSIQPPGQRIRTDHKVSLKPLGGWQEQPLKNVPSNCKQSDTTIGLGINFYAISTSFSPSTIYIEPSSTTEFISIVCWGVGSFRVTFIRDTATITGSSRDAKHEHQGSKNEINTIDISVPPPPAFVGDDGPRTLSFLVPYPCTRVEAMVLQRTNDFVCIFSVMSFCSTSVRSSSMSTPQSKTGGGRGLSGLSLY